MCFTCVLLRTLCQIVLISYNIIFLPSILSLSPLLDQFVLLFLDFIVALVAFICKLSHMNSCLRFGLKIFAYWTLYLCCLALSLFPGPYLPSRRKINS